MQVWQGQVGLIKCLRLFHVLCAHKSGDYPMEKALVHGSVDPDAVYDPLEIDKALGFLTPRNCR